ATLAHAGGSTFGPIDNFDEDNIATNFPGAYEDADAPSTVANGKYTIALASSTAGSNYTGLVTASGDFTGKQVSIDVAAYPASHAGLEAYLAVKDGSDLVFFRVNAGNLTCAQRISGVDTPLATVGPVSLTTHRFLRLREDSGTTSWEDRKSRRLN